MIIRPYRWPARQQIRSGPTRPVDYRENSDMPLFRLLSRLLALKHNRRLKNRGAAMIIARALTLCLTMVVVGTQIQVITQLKQAKGQRDYDRALQMAEAGANAYLNYLSNGNISSITPWDTPSWASADSHAAPPLISSPPTCAQVRSAILGQSGSIPVG